VPDPVVWKGHILKLPLGLLFEDERHGMVMRALWMESFLRPRVRGIDMTAAAISVTLPAEAGLACSVEPWFLRDTDRRFYNNPHRRARSMPGSHSQLESDNRGKTALLTPARSGLEVASDLRIGPSPAARPSG
jgi:hypothetical protein